MCVRTGTSFRITGLQLQFAYIFRTGRRWSQQLFVAVSVHAFISLHAICPDLDMRTPPLACRISTYNGAGYVTRSNVLAACVVSMRGHAT